MSKTPLNQHVFLAGTCISVHIPAFSKCNRWGHSSPLWAQSRFFPSLLAFPRPIMTYCHAIVSSHPPVKLHAWVNSQTPPSLPWAALTYLSPMAIWWALWNLTAFLLSSIHFLVPTLGRRGGAKHQCTHYCSAIQQGCKTPIATSAGNGKTILFVIWPVSPSEEEGNSATHSHTEPSPGPVWGRVSEEDGTLRGCTISLHPLRLGTCMLLDELQLWYRWT